MDLNGLKYGVMAGVCDEGDENLGTKRWRDIFPQAESFNVSAT
jgi:hypothetical protein